MEPFGEYVGCSSLTKYVLSVFWEQNGILEVLWFMAAVSTKEPITTLG